MKKVLDVAEIQTMPYTDFVGLVNQWNVLPGSYASLNKWALFSGLSKKSKLLEIACTTGFSSRELSLMTGCSAVGIDISKASVEKAVENKKKYASKLDITYQHIDAYQFEPKNKFTHIAVGAAIRFFPDPEGLMKKIVSMLSDNGYVLSTEFYVTKKIPSSLIKRAQQVFNITPTNIGYKDVMSIYTGLELLYEERNEIYQETEKELHHYTQSTIDRVVKEKNLTDKKVIQSMYDRLYAIKVMSNDLRPYQNYNVLVHRYRKHIYPNRYVELF